MIIVATEQWEFLSAVDLQFLSAAGAQVATALERARLYDLAQTHRIRLEKELEMARSVQRSLLPRQMPEIPGFTLTAEWRSAREVGGDFYDIFSLPDGRWGILLADVSGKGAPAALYMAMCRSLIRSEAVRHTSPAAVLTEVNRRLLSESASEMYVTVFYGILDPEGRSLTFASAGHEPPFLRRASGAVERSTRGGFFMGLFDQLSVADETLNLESGDTLVAFTDGVTDAVNQQDEDYGATRLATTINAAPDDAREMLAHILDDLATFTGEAPQQDDITLLVLKSE
jgi:sigma-B regulation protein RsbU (phosphoserine phosphatase)